MTSFAARGLVDLVPALAVMLGANIGTTLIVQALSFDIAAVAPVLFLAGLLAFNVGGRTVTRDLGRVAIGLGLMLLSLHILMDTLAPAESAPTVRALLSAITAEPVLSVLIAAALTWAAHSSAAVVLLVMSLAYSQFVSPAAALALVLGANLGSAINPLLEGGNSANPASRRLPVGNLINRPPASRWHCRSCADRRHLARPDADPRAGSPPTFTPRSMSSSRWLSFSCSTGWRRSWCGYCPTRRDRPIRPRLLSLDIGDSHAVGRAGVFRQETLHMGDVVGGMLSGHDGVDDQRPQACRRGLAHGRHRRSIRQAVKLYVTKVTRESLDDRNGSRAMEIIAFAINLEHMGDIIDKNLMELAGKKIKHKYEFSKDGAAELATFHKHIIENLKLAFSVFMNEDVRIARTLIEQKTLLRAAELGYADSHLARLREGRPESIETSSLHLDVLRDLKRIHSHICSVAYPVLEAHGELQPNRLKDSDGGTARDTASSLLPLPPRSS